MHKQDNTTTDPGLQSIIESMYTAASLEPLSEKHATAKCDHCGGTGKHGEQDCKKCGGDGWIDAKDVVIEAPGDRFDDEQYGQPSLGDLALSDDQSELTATLVDADGNSHSIAINMMDPVKVKLRPGQGPGAGESIIQLGFTVHPEETDRVPPQGTPYDRGYIPGHHD